MSTSAGRKIIFRTLLWGIPFLLWLWVQRSLWLGIHSAGGDNTQYYYWLTYFIDNLRHGVYPLWNPYHAWGSIDNFEMRCLGELNPFYLLILVLTAIGFSTYAAFLIFSIVYFMLGLLGFFFLAKRLAHDESMAFLAYVLLLFSTAGVTLFLQLIICLIFTPAVWFFLCALGFAESPSPKDKKKYFLGMTFTTMLLLITYLPFFWMTIIFCLIISLMILTPRLLGEFFKKIIQFVKGSPVIVIFCVFSIFLSAIPALSWYHETKDPNYVFQIGRNTVTKNDVMGVPIEAINMGGIASEASWAEYFENWQSGAQQFAYVPIFIFLLILLTMFSRLQRRQIVLFMTAFLLFLITLADVTPIFGFLYKYVRFFQLFRNYFFFFIFFIAIAILFVTTQLKNCLSESPKTRPERLLVSIYIICCHVLVLGFLSHHDDVEWSSYATVGLSAIFFLLWAWGRIKPGRIGFLIGLLGIAVLQPVQVLPDFQVLYARGRPAEKKHEPRFSYVRPVKGTGLNEFSGFHYRVKVLEDESGFVEKEYYGVQSAFELLSNVAFSDLQEYVRHKFVVYDLVSYMDAKNPDFGKLSKNLSALKNEAFIQEMTAVEKNTSIFNLPLQALTVEGPSNQLKVTRFDVNSIQIRTNFSQRKFLVYNDSYHPSWKARINGQPTPVFQTNIAFKGFWVAAGPQIIEMRFKPVWWPNFFIGLIIFFLGWLIYLGILCVQK